MLEQTIVYDHHYWWTQIYTDETDLINWAKIKELPCYTIQTNISSYSGIYFVDNYQNW